MHAKCKFLIVKIFKLMQQHTKGVVVNLIWVLLETYCSLQQWKKFSNRSSIDKVIAMVMVTPFFDSRCSVTHFAFAVVTGCLTALLPHLRTALGGEVCYSRLSCSKPFSRLNFRTIVMIRAFY